MDKKILVTGSCGFIGMHLCIKLLKTGYEVLGVDNINDYYSPKLKISRLKKLKEYDNFRFEKEDISNYKNLNQIFLNFKPQKVVNLAAQAGVRYSIENPGVYITSNIQGFMNILECCRHYDVDGLIYASSSSVYGANEKKIFSIEDNVDKPISIYGATKRANELMAYSYSSLYNLNTTGLRFFTVYGPWGRPDMAIALFADKIIKGKPIEVFNHGQMKRDFTYIDDIVEGIELSLFKNFKYEIFNLGSGKSIQIMYMVKLIEKYLGVKAHILYKDLQLGDIAETNSDLDHSRSLLGYSPAISFDDGVLRFLDWFKSYYS